MTRIANAEQVLLLLRAHLERSQRSTRKRTTAVKGRNGPMERVRELAAAGMLTESEVARALISGLLAEEFGSEATIDPRFAALVDEVQRLLESNETSQGVLKLAVAQISST